MQELERQGNYREIKLETIEELWMLSQVVRPGDTLYATDERKVKVGSEQNPKQVKKLLPITLQVKRAQFQHEQLRVTGEIRNETEYTTVGATHTVAYGVGDIIKIHKENWFSSDEHLLEQARTAGRFRVLIILLDKDDMVVAEFGTFSFSVLAEHQGLGSKKYTGQDIDEREEKFRLVADIVARGHDQIILAGPGHSKEGLKERLASEGYQTQTLQWDQVSTSSLQRLLVHIQKKGIITKNQLSIEQEHVDELLFRVNRMEKVAYGLDETKEAAQSGRIETFLITTDYLARTWEHDAYEEINALMQMVEQMSGSICIIESSHDPGKQLDALSGIAALLRY